MADLRLRRLPTYGWAIETDRGEVRAIKRDDGMLLPVLDELVGTREAAQSVGLQRSNFVRDWASRADFPAPVAELSSGRVWLASDVARYAASRRVSRPGVERLAEIARRIVWWQPSEQTLQRPLDFIARVMASGSLDEVRDVERAFGRRRLQDALRVASPGVFDARSWNYWLLILGIDKATPIPTRNAP